MDMTGLARRIGIGLLASALGCGIAVAQGWQHVGKVQRVEKLKDGVELIAGSAKVRVTVFRDGIFACGWRQMELSQRIFPGRSSNLRNRPRSRSKKARKKFGLFPEP